MKKSKKGITLVELIICCTIIAMIGGACSAVIASGSTMFNQSSKTAHSQLDLDVLQTFMMNILPSASNIQVHDGNSIGTKYLYFNETDGEFTVRVNDSNTTIQSISKFEYAVVQAGVKDDSRAQFLYQVTLDDGSSINGGFVLSNISFNTVPDVMKKGISQEGVQQYIDLVNVPIVFNVSAGS